MEKKEPNTKADSELIGRISKQAEGEEGADRADISHIDRQEGEMDHGETGGNFREEER